MITNQVFLTRLRRIVGEPALREESSARALELFDQVKVQLYAQFGISPSDRPTLTAKEQVDRALAELRQSILSEEVAAVGAASIVLTAVRHRIEMTRRALATRLARDSLTDLQSG